MEDYVEDQEIKLETRRTIEPAETLEGKRTKTWLREKDCRLEKDEDSIVFDRDALMDKEQRLAERAQELWEPRRDRETASAKQVRPESQEVKTWTHATSSKTL